MIDVCLLKGKSLKEILHKTIRSINQSTNSTNQPNKRQLITNTHYAIDGNAIVESFPPMLNSMNHSGRKSINILVVGDGTHEKEHSSMIEGGWQTPACSTVALSVVIMMLFSLVFSVCLSPVGVGKTSLISSLVSDNFNSRVPSVLQPVQVSAALTVEGVPLTVIDTRGEGSEGEAEVIGYIVQKNPSSQHPSSSSSSSPSMGKSPLTADCVLLVVSSDVADSFARVESYWLPLIELYGRRDSIGRIPVIVAINKSAREDDGTTNSSMTRVNRQHEPFDHISAPSSSLSSHPLMFPPAPHHPFDHLLHNFRLAGVIHVSAKYMKNISECFFACCKVILSPIEPLFDLFPSSAVKPIPSLSTNSAALDPSASVSATVTGTQAQAQTSTGAGTAAVAALQSSQAHHQPTMKFKLLTQKALLRIFRLFDHDSDGLLNFVELDHFHQVAFRGKKLSVSLFDETLKLLRGQGGRCAYVATSPRHGKGVTFAGFLWFHYKFLIKDHHLSNCWYLVRVFGYELSTNPMLLPAPSQASSSSSSSTMALASGPPLLRTNSLNGSTSVTNSNVGVGSGSSLPLVTSSTTVSSSPSVPVLPQQLLPPLGSLVLRETDYYNLPFAYQPLCTYELSPVAIDFLTDVFNRFDTDQDGSISYRSGGNDVLNPATYILQAQTNEANRHQRHAHAHAHANGVSSAVASTTYSSSSPSSLPPPSASNSLMAHTDLENLFLASPDIPFILPTFAQYLPQSRKGLGYLDLDGWLSAWSMMLWSVTTVPVTPILHHPTQTHFNLAQAPVLPSSSSSLATAACHHAPNTFTHTNASQTPNPDNVLRYLTYIGFPVTPAQPEFTLVPKATSSSERVKVHLPKVSRCIHLAPKSLQHRASVNASIACNESILSTDPGFVSGSASVATASIGSRSILGDPANWRPNTVMCHVMGAPGSGVTSFIQCMIGAMPTSTGAAPTAASSMSSPLSSSTSSPFAQHPTALHAHLHGRNGTPTMTSMAAPNGADPPTTTDLSASAHYHHQQVSQHSHQPRTFACRLPLPHIPQAAVDAYMAASTHSSSSSSSSSSSLPSSLESSNRFLILKEIPSKLSDSYLLSPSFTPTSGHLVLLLYDGTSHDSLLFVHQRLQICFEKQLPVIVIQTKTDCTNCSYVRTDFLSLDYVPHVEEFSARTFWSIVQSEELDYQRLPSAAHMMHIFHRIHQAAAHTSEEHQTDRNMSWDTADFAYCLHALIHLCAFTLSSLSLVFLSSSNFVLTSLSAAARSSRVTRNILCGLLVTAAIGVGYMTLMYHRKSAMWQTATRYLQGTTPTPSNGAEATIAITTAAAAAAATASGVTATNGSTATTSADRNDS